MRRMLSGIATVAIAGGLVAPAIAAACGGGGGPAGSVAICHATSSAKNPYVLIHPSARGVVSGHLAHQDQRDVVPPFTYHGRTYSQNWDAAGQALFAAGCHVTTAPPDGGGGDGGPSL
jgi:hypothetical protein